MWSLIKHEQAIYKNKVQKKERKRERESLFGKSRKKQHGGKQVRRVNDFNCHIKCLKWEGKDPESTGSVELLSQRPKMRRHG